MTRPELFDKAADRLRQGEFAVFAFLYFRSPDGVRPETVDEKLSQTPGDATNVLTRMRDDLGFVEASVRDGELVYYITSEDECSTRQLNRSWSAVADGIDSSDSDTEPDDSERLSPFDGPNG